LNYQDNNAKLANAAGNGGERLSWLVGKTAVVPDSKDSYEPQACHIVVIG
jgi:hypothetical protein